MFTFTIGQPITLNRNIEAFVGKKVVTVAWQGEQGVIVNAYLSKYGRVPLLVIDIEELKFVITQESANPVLMLPAPQCSFCDELAPEHTYGELPACSSCLAFITEDLGRL